MSALPVETMETDPAATSLPNEETLKTEGLDKSAPTDISTETPTNGANGSNQTEVEAKEASDENRASTQNKNGENLQKKPRQRTYEDGMLKTSAQQEDGKNNSKYDPSVLPVSDDHTQMRSQVEFYFGDTNLPKDKFMWELTGGAENLPVPIEKICSFGRMRRFQPQSEIVVALKASKFLEVTGEDGHEQVKRKHAFDPTLPKSKGEAQSVYVKGFGDEEPSSQFDIEAFFAPYGPTNEVRLRRTDHKLFKGSVFVEFENEEIAKKFLELDPKPLWKGVHTLEVISKTQYIEKKAQEIRDGKIEPKVHRGGFRGNNRGRGGDSRGRGDRKGNDRGGRGGRNDRDPDDWKKRREDDRASGFKDNRRDGRGDRRGNSRGGRGGDRRDDRGPRNNDRNREREEKNKETKAEAKVESPKNDKKRAREDDDVEHAPAKKVDVKSEVPAAS